jgi:hypothetical protein
MCWKTLFLFLSSVDSGVHVTRSVVLYVVFCRLLFVLLFYVGHCVVYPFSFTGSDYPFGIFKHFWVFQWFNNSLRISGALGTQSLVFCVGLVFCSPLGISGALGTQSLVFCVGLVFCSPLGISGALGTQSLVFCVGLVLCSPPQKTKD